MIWEEPPGRVINLLQCFPVGHSGNFPSVSKQFPIPLHRVIKLNGFVLGHVMRFLRPPDMFSESRKGRKLFPSWGNKIAISGIIECTSVCGTLSPHLSAGLQTRTQFSLITRASEKSKNDFVVEISIIIASFARALEATVLIKTKQTWSLISII
ncbi:hypothetical protein TNCV_1166611 [Trichonephila clavipes]|uniref:Uncharacterized protein n=1 Tax=Trichonephila clavipes TaxID=2585209 RepID=A0A8X6T8L2_TRICX|nr:hypothetical protein TNCV_1166611 [Trichonephila clavipes]